MAHDYTDLLKAAPKAYAVSIFLPFCGALDAKKFAQEGMPKKARPYSLKQAIFSCGMYYNAPPILVREHFFTPSTAH